MSVGKSGRTYRIVYFPTSVFRYGEDLRKSYWHHWYVRKQQSLFLPAHQMPEQSQEFPTMVKVSVYNLPLQTWDEMQFMYILSKHEQSSNSSVFDSFNYANTSVRLEEGVVWIKIQDNGFACQGLWVLSSSNDTLPHSRLKRFP